jgi:hypothetical protein
MSATDLDEEASHTHTLSQPANNDTTVNSE